MAVYMEIWRGTFRLPQSGILANKLLKECLTEHRYYELPHTLDLFRHETRPIWFMLVVDDFGIKYVGEEHVKHFLDNLRKYYEVEIDWKVSLYCGITLA